MPTYIYTDGEHRREVRHRMLYTTAVICDDCGSEMWRVPQPVAVNWNGPPPHRGDVSPEIRNVIDNADERRDRYWQKKEARNE